MFSDFDEAGGFSSVNHCETFRCYRHSSDDPENTYEVRVDIFDIGPNSPTPMRYWVLATRHSDGKQTQGNAAPTVKEALTLFTGGYLISIRKVSRARSSTKKAADQTKL
jgi:hypothetical protein